MTNNNIKLTTKSGSISNCLNTNKDYIAFLFSNNSVTLVEMKSKIKDLIININDKDLTQKSQGTKKFLISLDKSTNKTKILELVWNTMLSGDGLKVIK